MTDELSRKRMEKERNSKAWTAEDCLEAALEDVRAGRLKADKLIILGHEEHSNGFDTVQYQSGTTYLEYIGMLQFALIESTRDLNS